MGLFDKLKNIISKKEEHVKEQKEESKTLNTYDKGLEKTRTEFISKLSLLGHKYTKVTESYYEELED